MSRREDVQTGIWSDPDFLDLSAEAKVVYLWSFTNPRCGMAGLYKVAGRIAQFETGLDPERFEAAMAELQAGGFVRFEKSVLWVRSRLKHMRSRTDQIAKSALSDIRSVGVDHPLSQALIAEYVDCDWEFLAEALRGLSEGQPPSMDPRPRLPRTSDDAQPSVHGKGKGKGSSKGSSSTSGGREPEPDEFVDWLAFHEQTTGMKPPKPGTKARAAVLAAFRERIAEDYSVDDLKLAVVGAFADNYRRENGYVGAESVLRPRKIHDLIERGRGGGPKLRAVAGGAGPNPHDDPSPWL